MKILHVLKSKIFSGAENVATSIIRNMPSDVESVYLTASGPIETKLLDFGINYIAVDEVTVDEIKKAIEKVQPDIIHAHDFGCGLMCAKSTNDIPIVSHLHSNPGWIRKIDPRSITYGGVCKNFVKILTVSEAVEKEAWFKDKMKGKTLCVGNPFSAKKVFEKGYLAGTELNDEKKNSFKSDLLYVGRLTPEKNPLEFIHIVDEVRRNVPQVKAIMVGNGELGSKCIKLIEKLGLHDNIKMVGFQANPYNYMNYSKVVVMPSKYEGFGLVALESMTFSKPVLGSKVGGLQTIVNENCGYICGDDKQPVDRALFSKHATELLTNQATYEAKSACARKRAKEYDNFETYMNSVYSIYKEILGIHEEK